jgi:hypothetical protein
MRTKSRLLCYFKIMETGFLPEVESLFFAYLNIRMTSLLREYKPPSQESKFVNIVTPCYYDASIGNTSALVPFSYSNGVLDINIQDDIVAYINNPSAHDSSYLGKRVKRMGGEGFVTSLGPNVTTLLQNWVASHESDPYSGPINIVVQPTVTRVQAVQAPWGVNPLPRSPAVGPAIAQYTPTNDDYIISGSPANNYYSAWVFKSPLTVSYVWNGVTKYITLSTVFN